MAVLKPDADENGRDIVVKMRGGALKTINETHRGYDPLHFVILHPAGDDGWKIGMTKTGSKQSVSPCDFYAYRVQWRVDQDGANSLLMSCRLFQARKREACPESDRVLPYIAHDRTSVSLGVRMQRLCKGGALQAAMAASQSDNYSGRALPKPR